jgi:hypothetical protein
MEGNNNIVNGDGNATVAGDGNIGVNGNSEKFENILSKIQSQTNVINALKTKMNECSAECQIQIDELKKHFQNDGRVDKLEKQFNELAELKSRIDKLEKRLKRKCRIFLIFIAASFVFSLLAICRSTHAFPYDSMAFLGWTVAVLSMLVVVLMGWHIFNILNLKDALKKVDVLNGDIYTQKQELVKINREIDIIKNSIEIFNGLINVEFNDFLFHCENGNYAKGLQKLMSVITKFNDLDISTKDYYANKAATFLEGKEIRMSSLDKSVIESLSGISYPYGHDIPEKLRKIINNINIV